MSTQEKVPSASNGGGKDASPESRDGLRPKTSGYSTPGEGPSTAISVVTMTSIFALWWVASHLGWMPPLFLPTPEVGRSGLRRRAYLDEILEGLEAYEVPVDLVAPSELTPSCVGR